LLLIYPFVPSLKTFISPLFPTNILNLLTLCAQVVDSFCVYLFERWFLDDPR
jgi:hypothetical protein